MTAQSVELELDTIGTVEGHNPRRIDESDEAFQELVASIGQVGVLSPILVMPQDHGGEELYRVIAGERRYRAAKQAGLKKIPVLLTGAEADQAEVMAMVENVQRQDLTPGEEAKAIARLEERMSVAEIAKAFSKTEAWVKGRRRISELPPRVVAQIDSGEIPLAATAELARINAISPAICGHIAKLAVAHKEVHLLATNAGEVLRGVRRSEAPPKGTVLIPAHREAYRGRSQAQDVYEALKAAGVPKKDLEEFSEAYNALPEPHQHDYDARFLRFGTAEIDAANSYGCLLKFGAKGQEKSSYIVDPAFVLDRLLTTVLPAEGKRRETERARYSSPAQQSKQTAEAERAELSADERKQLKETKLKARQKECDARAAVYDRNLELGAMLRKKCSTVKLSAEVIDLLTGCLGVQDYGAAKNEIDPHGWPARYAYVDERYHTVEWKQTKSQRGSEKTGFVKVWPFGKGYGDDHSEQTSAFEKEREKAKTPGAIAAFYLRLILAARFADVGVSNHSVQPSLGGAVRHHEKPPNTYSARGDGRLELLADKIAVDLGVLPPALLKDAQKRLAK